MLKKDSCLSDPDNADEIVARSGHGELMCKLPPILELAMTTQAIQDRVDVIRKMANREISVPSDGYPHHNEYNLWKDVLTEIAQGKGEPILLAQEALKTLEIDFDRFFS
jgi:hypothetical protein